MYKIFSRQLLIRPDLTPYLMASTKVKLLASEKNVMVWTTTPQVVANTISNQALGTSKYLLSFEFDSALLTQGTTYILREEGLVDFGADNGFLTIKPDWAKNWSRVPQSAIKQGMNFVSLQNDGAVISLQVNEKKFVLLDTTESYNQLDYINNGCSIDGPIATGSTNNGYIQAKATPNFNTANTWSIRTRYTYIANSSVSYPGILGPLTSSPRYCPELAIQSSNHELYCNLSSNGSSADIGGSGGIYLGYYLENGKTYDFDYYFDGKKYALKISTDGGETFQEIIVANTSTKVYGTDEAILIFLNTRALQGGRNNLGSIELRKTEIIADGTKYSEETVYPYSLPDITTGKLWVQETTKIKNIYAIKGE